MPVDLMVMANTLRWDNPNKVLRCYDLKGSTENRHVRMDEHYHAMKTLKDTNLVINKRAKQEVNVTREQRHKILEQLFKDTLFFREKGIMDYSLLLGIEERGNGKNTSFAFKKK